MSFPDVLTKGREAPSGKSQDRTPSPSRTAKPKAHGTVTGHGQESTCPHLPPEPQLTGTQGSGPSTAGSANMFPPCPVLGSHVLGGMELTALPLRPAVGPGHRQRLCDPSFRCSGGRGGASTLCCTVHASCQGRLWGVGDPAHQPPDTPLQEAGQSRPHGRDSSPRVPREGRARPHRHRPRAAGA